MNAVIEHTPTNLPQSAAEIRAHVNRIQEVMKAVMVDKTHYGTIPGTPKPTLYKAGSEVLLSTFRIAVKPRVEDLSTNDEIRYRVTCVGEHQTSGIVIGEGVGECSSSEDKYRWRSAVCKEEFEETPPDRRRQKWKRGSGGKAYSVQQVRTEPADVANTVLKMAKKRAQVDMTLTALAASDIFTQDLEDASEEMRDTVGEQEGDSGKATEPKSKGGDGKATAAQVNLITKKAEKSGIAEADLLAHFEIATLADLPFDKVNQCLEFVKERASGG